MSAYDDIAAGLDEIFRSAFVSGSTKGSYKQKYRAEYDRVKAYLGGGAFPDPFPTTLMGSGLTKVERGRRTLAPVPPPPNGFPIPTFQAEITEDNYPYMVGNQGWAFCTSPTTGVGSWGGRPARELRTPMDQNTALSSWEWWSAWQINFIDWNMSNQGSINSTPEDWHTMPGQPGWNSSDPENGKYVVSPVHVRYRDGSYNVAHEPNYPNHQFPIVSYPVAPGWHSVLMHTIFGRKDAPIPTGAHPNNGRGRTRVAWDGQWVLDTGDVNNLWYSPTAPSGQQWTTRLMVLEGLYCPSSTRRKFQYTLARFGRTREECMSDSQFSNISWYGGTEGGTQPHISRIADRSSSDFVGP